MTRRRTPPIEPPIERARSARRANRLEALVIYSVVIAALLWNWN